MYSSNGVGKFGPNNLIVVGFEVFYCDLNIEGRSPSVSLGY
jgi:hypothetical protein